MKLINTRDDIDWLFDTALRRFKTLRASTKSAYFTGNDDSPQYVELFAKKRPLVTDARIAAFQANGDNDLVLVERGGVVKNPAKRKPGAKFKGTARIGRASQATGKPPTKRLKARRARNRTPGVFPNPAGKTLPKHIAMQRMGYQPGPIPNKRVLLYTVQSEVKPTATRASGWKTEATFADKKRAFEYARAFNAAWHIRVRVID